MSEDFEFVNENSSDKSLENGFSPMVNPLKCAKDCTNDVFMMDHINKINKFGMPLLNALANTNYHSFNARFVSLQEETDINNILMWE